MFSDYYQFARNNYHFLLFGLLTAFFGNLGQTFFIAWFGESFKTAFQLSSAEYGLVYSGATLTSGFCIFFAGALLDKIPLKKFTFITSAGLAAGCFIVAAAHSVWLLVVAIFLLRFCGQGLMFHIAFTSMARYYQKNRGKAIGIVGFGMPIGEAILPLIVVGLIALFGWRQSWVLLGLTIILGYWPVMNYLINQSTERLNQNRAAELKPSPCTCVSWSRGQVVRDLRFWILIPFVMAPAFIVTGIFIHQSVLLSSKNWSESWFALSFIVYAFSHLKASLVIGSLVDKYSGRQLLPIYLLPMFFAVVLLALPLDHQLFTLVFMFLLGLTVGASGPIVGSFWVEIYGNQHIGAIRSMVTSIMVVSTAISPVLFGWLFDQEFRYTAVMNYLICYLVIAWLLVKFYVLSSVNKP